MKLPTCSSSPWFHEKSTLLAVLLISAVFILFPNVAETKVVVLLSVPHTANVRTHTNVGRSLAELGHQPYVLIPQFMLKENLVNVEGINVISYGEYLGNFEEVLTRRIVEKFWKGEAAFAVDMQEVVKVAQETARLILADQSLMEKLRSIKPDLFVLTNVPPFKNIVILPYNFNVPFVFMSPFNDLHGFRVPLSPAATPCLFSSVVSPESFLDRLKMSACNVILMAVGIFIGNNSMLEEFAPHRPKVSISELVLKAEVYLVEGDFVLDFPKPQLPNMKVIGCTAPSKGKPLKDPFKTFVEGSKKGIAVVTFGSSVVELPEKIADMMTAAFEQQDLSVVWRVNITSKNPSKILTSTWVPQNDLLAHPKTKLFVSHCGANGQYEAVYHGVPMLCLPLFGDQTYNAQRSTARGFGLKANILELSSSQLAQLMAEVSGNATYAINIKRASVLFRQLYSEPHKSAAFWIDHVMTYGGSYMRSAGQDMPLYQFFALDVAAFCFLVVAFLCVLLILMCRCCCCIRRKLFGKSKLDPKKKKE